jgi:hypothetical protein
VKEIGWNGDCEGGFDHGSRQLGRKIRPGRKIEAGNLEYGSLRIATHLSRKRTRARHAQNLVVAISEQLLHGRFSRRCNLRIRPIRVSQQNLNNPVMRLAWGRIEWTGSLQFFRLSSFFYHPFSCRKHRHAERRQCFLPPTAHLRFLRFYLVHHHVYKPLRRHATS